MIIELQINVESDRVLKTNGIFSATRIKSIRPELELIEQPPLGFGKLPEGTKRSILVTPRKSA